MSTSDTKKGPTIGGIEASKWIGRLVKVRSESGDPNHRKARVVAFDNKSVSILSSGVQGTQKVSYSKILPWWSENADLKREAESSGVNPEKPPRYEPPINDMESAFAEAKNRDRKPRHVPVAVSTQPEMEAPEPAPPARQEAPPAPIQQTLPKAPAPMPSTATRGKIIGYQADADCDLTWPEDIGVLRKALADVEELEGLLEAARDTVEEKLIAIAEKGVTIVWSKPVAAAAPDPNETSITGRLREWFRMEAPSAGVFTMRDVFAKLGLEMTNSNQGMFRKVRKEFNLKESTDPETQALRFEWVRN